MTDVPIRVRIISDEATQGKAAVVRSLKDIRMEAANTNEKLGDMGKAVNRGAKEALSGVDLLKRGLAALGGVLLVKRIVQLGATFQELQNRVILSSSSMEVAAASLDKLFNIANEAGAPISELVSLFQKGSIAAKELGASQADLFKFTEIVAKSLALQGGSAAAASGALLQLSQSLGGGIVRAEEFNSILEGAFPIAQAAARGLDAAGGSVARLRQLVIEGKVSSEAFFKALLSQGDEVNALFDKLQPTIGRALTKISNEFVRLAGQGEGVFAVLAKALFFIADNLETIVKVATAAGIALAVSFAPAIAAIGVIVTPLGAIVGALTAIALFSDDITVTSDGLGSLWDLIAVIGSDAMDLFSSLGSWFKDVFGGLGDFMKDMFGDINLSLEGVAMFAAKVVDRYIGLWRGAFNAVVEIFKGFPNAIAAIFTEALNSGIDLVEGAVNKIADALNTLPGISIGKASLGRLDNKYIGEASKFGGKVGDAFKEGFNQTVVQDYVKDVFGRASARGAAGSNKPSLENLLGGGATGAAKAAAAGKGAGGSGKGKNEILPWLQEAETEINSFGKAFDSVMLHSSSSLSKFVRTGKLDFSSFIGSILDDLSKIAVEDFVVSPLRGVANSMFGSLFNSPKNNLPWLNQGGGGGGIGSFFSGIGDFFGFDQGVNYVPRDMYARLHRGERVVSARDNQNGGGMGNNITVNYVMPNVSDYASFRQNQAQSTAETAKMLQNSMRRNN